MINRDKLEHILEYARQQRHIGQSCKVPPEDMVEIMERLLSACNSPAIPDGYVMVPKGLLSELRDWAHPEIEKYCEMWEGRRDSEFPALRKVIADADALLAAGPQSPGSDPATVPGKWIPVSERMPEDRTQVILWDAEIGEVTSGHYSHKTHTFYHCGDAIENEITHWMAPPAAPQEVK
ncbi:hypothetical protein B6I70_25600 [Klebsiella pneumoniae]|nr:hypothetical protein B6I70_25600 [Klebsiella pneumoniae]